MNDFLELISSLKNGTKTVVYQASDNEPIHGTVIGLSKMGASKGIFVAIIEVVTSNRPARVKTVVRV